MIKVAGTAFMQQKNFKTFDEFCKHFSIESITTTKNFQEAMTHTSVSKNHSYERMEFLGDTILNFCVSQMIFEIFPDKREGEMSKIKSFLISRKVCREIAEKIKLEEKVKVSTRQPIDKKVVLADCIESLICCIYAECGLTKVYEIVKSLFSPYLFSEKITDPKMQLQEYTQKHYKCLPVYNLIEKTGEEHRPVFKVSCSFSKFYNEAEGSTKKEAERNCATKLLKILNQKTEQKQ